MDLIAHLPDECRALCCSARRMEFCSKLKPQRNKATTLPKGKVLVAGSVLLNNHFGAILIFPFLPFMVQDFFPELSKEELGKKAGYLGSSYFLGSFAGSLLWGWLSDQWGRRPVMMLGICGSIFSELLFGFSQNFTWAVSARFLWGLLNGNLGVAKTYLSEVCDDSNLAKGFAVVGASGGIGRLIGSTLGGFLAQPASKYAVFEHPLFCRFPYLLPCMSAAGLALASLIATCLFMEETLHKGRFTQHEVRLHDSHQELTNQNAESSDTDSDVTEVEMMSLSSDVSDSLSVELLTNQIAESDIDSQSDSTVIPDSGTELLLEAGDVGVVHRSRCGWIKRQIKELRAINPASCARRFFHRQQQQCLECCWCCVCRRRDHAHHQTSHAHHCTSHMSCRACCQQLLRIATRAFHGAKRILKLLRDRRVFLSITLYVLFGMLSLSMHEVIPLLVVNDHQHGGFHMDDNEIGVLAIAAAVVEFLFQVFLYSPMAQLLGFRWMYRTGVAMFVIGCVLIPFSNAITGPIVSNQSNITTGGSGSGWAGSGFNSTDYCGLDTAGSEGAVNEDSIKRLPPLVWLVAEVALLCVVVPNLVGMTSVMVMIGNSSLPETRGTINGVAQSLVAVMRFVGPTLGALSLAWSEQNTDQGLGWPLNYHFVFDVFALLGLLVIFISLFLPKSIEKKRQN